jgi:Xaa-Pro aminopeptidase
MGANRDLVLRGCQPALEVPFSLVEYQDRLERVREGMAEREIDLLYLTAPESLFYVSGYACEWYQAQSPKQWPATSGIAVHVDHDDFILFDTPSEQIMVRFVTVARDVRIFPLESRRDGIAFIVDELAAEGWLGGAVGLELHSYRPNPAVSARFRAAFQEAGCAVVDGSDVLREARWVKSPQEIAYIEQAGRIADVGLAAARDALAPGVTELEVYGEMVRAMALAGGEAPGITMPVLSGPKANCGHALAGRKTLQAGEQVNVDVCGVFNRYHCNAARSFFLGQPPRAVVEHYDKAARAFEVIEAELRPGLLARDLMESLREYYEDAGIWRDQSWLGGYEMGIAFPPDWVGNVVYELSDMGTDTVFTPGTAVNYESVFYGPAMTGLTYLIETLIFRDDEAAIASRLPRGLTVIA